MNDSDLSSEADLSPVLARRLDEECNRFEAAWRTGGRPCLDDFLSETDELYPVLLRELIGLDIHYRRLAGEWPRAVDYQPRCAGLETAWLEEALSDASIGSPSSSVRSGDTPAAAGNPTESRDLLLQRTFGNYELLGEIARGGMGVVYKARQRHPARLVALKMILAAAHAGAERRSRFLAEADAIARLDHPNIVRIYEIGEHEGLPFLSLEYVGGGSLAQKLGGVPQAPGAAAALLETLARAVHFAHQNGVVHRDLKPANILLQEDGTTKDTKEAKEEKQEPQEDSSSFRVLRGSSLLPKITDFGLAKGERPELTATGAVLGTPSYMAPEQAEGKTGEVGPAADVWALGAILYECLTGRPPFRAETALETLDLVRTQEPVAPTRMQPKVPRDLETICLKCLRKEPAKRYTCAGALAEDLHLFLSGRPVLARRTAPWERAWKWARRQPVVALLVAVSAAAVLTLLAVWTSLTLSLRWERNRANDAAADANTQRKRAEISRERAWESVERFLTRTGEQRLATIPGMTEVRRELLEDAVKLQEEFLRDSNGSDPETRHRVARAHQRVAILHRWLQDRPREEESCLKGMALLHDLASADPGNPTYQHDLVRVYYDLGVARAGVKGRTSLAEEAFGRSQRIGETLVRLHPRVPEYRADLARTMVRLGRQYSRRAAPVKAQEDLYLRGLEIQEALRKERPESIDFQADEANTRLKLGALYHRTNRPVAAAETFERARELMLGVLRVRPKDSLSQSQLANCCNALGVVFATSGKTREAAAAYEQSYSLFNQLARDNPAVPYYPPHAALAALNLGLLYLEDQQWDRARKALQQALDIDEALLRRDPKRKALPRDIADIYLNMGNLERGAGRFEQSARWTKASLALVEPLAREHPQSREATLLVGNALHCRGLELLLEGKAREALTPLGRAAAVIERLLKREPHLPPAGQILTEIYLMRGDVRLGLGERIEALADWARASRLYFRGAAHYRQNRALVRLLTLALSGNYVEAAREADALWRDSQNPFNASFSRRLAYIYVLAGNEVRQSVPLPVAEKTRIEHSYHGAAIEVVRASHRAERSADLVERRILEFDPLLGPLLK